MPYYRVAGFLGTAGVLLLSSVAHAQCTKDTDCKGDRVCNAGVCSPAPASAPAAAPAVAAAPAAAPAAAAPVAAAPQAPPPQPVKGERHSTGMMVGGIVMASFAPVALITAGLARAEQITCEGFGFDNTSTIRQDCDEYDATIYGGLLAAAVLVGVGIPLIVIGGKREAPRTASVQPWATPHGGGLGFRMDL